MVSNSSRHIVKVDIEIIQGLVGRLLTGRNQVIICIDLTFSAHFQVHDLVEALARRVDTFRVRDREGVGSFGFGRLLKHGVT